MADKGTDSTALIWSVPECPFTIETSARVLDDIRLAVTDAFFSLPRGGAEIGGILLGTFNEGRLVISDYAALECEHAYGPSFALSPNDEARLRDLHNTHFAVSGGPRPVGWYHSHTRSEIFLSEADLAIHNRFFPEPWQVALVMKPHTMQPARIGFFFRQADGGIHSATCYREEALEALPLQQVPTGAPTVPASDAVPPRSFRQSPIPVPSMEPAPQPSPQPRSDSDLSLDDIPVEKPAPEPVDLPVPKFAIESASAARRWMVGGIAIVGGLGILVAAFAVRDMWLPQVLAAIRPAPAVTAPAPAPVPPPVPAPVPTLGLSTLDREGQLQISWDRSSPALGGATDALLEISDGPLPVAIQLDPAHLETGSFTYARTTEKVDVKLIVHRKDSPDVREIASFLGKLPERRPEEAEKQAAKLSADMTAQAAKTRKLEKEVQAMREEMRKQQLRRLNNQLPDK
jgi:proteasome lid subunit RPN8/RPN11